jgi:rod shape-determining protein MreD
MSLGDRGFEQNDALHDSLSGRLKRTAMLLAQVLVLAVLSCIPFDLWHLSQVRPAFLLMGIYYWGVFRPGTLTPLAAFLIGLLLDLLYACPPGLNALNFVCVQWLTGAQRKFLSSQTFIVLWMCFLLTAAASALFQWAAMSLFAWSFMPVKPVLAGALLTWLFFPLAAGLLHALGRKFSGR